MQLAACSVRRHAVGIMRGLAAIRSLAAASAYTLENEMGVLSHVIGALSLSASHAALVLLRLVMLAGWACSLET